ncbi:catalase-domain-containing protein [Myriangium duriaei CBS 260.36]|uniref:Catalase-domain-containing protein n=1 Tax=Myriangium duriaei CBS 260.36 TaxID=1168546 RepID=A0A9P4MFB6_9PEZI|nr:catalase-domain-containing protein [Myriangium duriaei CBS 260.36]
MVPRSNSIVAILVGPLSQPWPDPGSAQEIRLSSGNGGLAVLSDTQLIEVLAHFSRERIPERMVHAKAAGAFGFFEVLDDVSDITDAHFLAQVGRKTDVLTRISTVGGEKGSSDTVRDVRGWSLKFYTDEGNQDFVFNDLPVFFLRDPIKFPSMNRSHKKHPQTNVPDNTMFWDYHINNPEGIHALMHLFGQRGIPASLRHISGFGVHTYTLSKQDGSFVYIKWHIKPEGGIETLDSATAVKLAGTEPDYHVKDLFNAIDKGDFPTWLLYVQVMKPEEASKAPFDIFDCTFTWPHAQFPLRRIGRLTLNRNPHNYFQDIEQAAFSPSNMVPGIGPSADIVLQARMFAYPDAARYRLGPNYQLLPSNVPHSPVYNPYERDGPGRTDGNYGGDPDYVRSSLRPMRFSARHAFPTHEEWRGRVEIRSTGGVEERDFEQPRILWGLIRREGEAGQFVENIAPTLVGVEGALRERVYEYFARVEPNLAQAIREGVQRAGGK